jgi:carbamate kinase
MRIVVALGGNALLRRGEPLEAAVQRRNLARAGGAVAAVACTHEIVVSHGNGPQIGLIALQALAYRPVAAYPLDILGAESEGMIGYLIEQELMARLPGREFATLLTQVEVDAADPAFSHPTKPIGPIYDAESALRLARASGWSMAPDGAGFRRVVPSPEPKRIIELNAIRRLVAAGLIVICAGGGGVPVVHTAGGGVRGVEAVIDKDLSAALLAGALAADGLLLLTDVPAVYADWGTAAARPIGRATVADLRKLSFAAGSMGPKVEAACRFVEATNGWAAIGALADAERLVAHATGTIIRRATAT